MEHISQHILRTTVPYKDIYTTVCLVRTDMGALLFDTASYDEDVPAHILPFLAEAGVAGDELKYIFISHDHSDHAGGLKALIGHYPDAQVLSRSVGLRERFPLVNVHAPADGETVLGVLRVVTVPGHTSDSAAIFDTRTNTLLTGDCLQLCGIYGSGKWGANISYPAEHIKAVEKLRGMTISEILAAHDYHPLGHHFIGAENISAALDACLAPLDDIRRLIAENPGMDDDGIAEIYNSCGLPVIGAHVVKALRNA